MKLIFCRECQDVVKLRRTNWRKCQCGKSSGRYLADGWYAEIRGSAVPICFLNSTLLHAIKNRPESGDGTEFTAFVASRSHESIKTLKNKS